jgi:hypothetical protein
VAGRYVLLLLHGCVAVRHLPVDAARSNPIASSVDTKRVVRVTHRVTVWPHRTVKGWERGSPPEDKNGEPPARFPVVPVLKALETVSLSDAHFVPYRVPGVEVCPRVNQGGLAELESRGLGLVYDVLPIDLDAPKNETARIPIEGEADRNKWPARAVWQADQLSKVSKSMLWATCGWYLTRGGVRLLWLLPEGTPRLEYLERLAALRAYLTGLGLSPDPLVDFGRCYRLPFVIRDGEPTQVRWHWENLGVIPPLPALKRAELAKDFAGVDTARLGPFELPAEITEGARDRTLTSYAGQLRHKGYGSEMLLSALMLANASRCKPPLAQADLQRIARSISRYDPDPTAATKDKLTEIVVRRGALPELVDAAEQTLVEGKSGVYQRGGELVRVQRDPEPTLGMAPGAAHIRATDKHALRELLARLARWVAPKRASAAEREETGSPWRFDPVDVPLDVVDALRGRRQWPKLAPLTGVVETPTLRPDGSVLATTGYDEQTGLVFSAAQGFVWPVIPETPSRDDAVQARMALQEIVCDFPFATRAHESVALAAMLTVIGRPAVRGATPLFIFDATTPGSGKGLLAHTIATLATGHSAGVMIQTEAPEMEKRTTALLLAGERVILIDNLDRPLGGASIDAAITADVWQGRRLGQSEMIRAPNRATWIATGNNVAIKGDLARRCLRVYLVPEVERPEERRGFRHPNLLQWVSEQRGRLVCAGLTILRAYVAAGAPDVPLTAFGGFGAWSRLVRSALVWTGATDPCETRAEIRAVADGAFEALSALLESWEALFGAQHKTIRDVLTVVESQAFGGAGGASSEAIEGLRESLLELCGNNRGEIDPRRAGWLLRRVSGRIVAGRRFERVERTSRGGVAWRVVRCDGVVAALVAGREGKA